MTPTLAEVKADIYATLDVNPEGVDAVYDYEPHNEVSGPCYVTIEVDNVTATEQVWAVRVYSQIEDSPQDGANTRDTAVNAVDDLLKASSYGPSEWQMGFDDALGCLVARTFLRVPRDIY